MTIQAHLPAAQHRVPAQGFVQVDGLQPPVLVPDVLVPEEAVAHEPAWHVWLMPVQSLHMPPPVPHCVSSVPPWQLPALSQQPWHVEAHVPASSLVVPDPASSVVVPELVSPELVPLFSPPLLAPDVLSPLAVPVVLSPDALPVVAVPLAAVPLDTGPESTVAPLPAPAVAQAPIERANPRTIEDQDAKSRGSNINQAS